MLDYETSTRLRTTALNASPDARYEVLKAVPRFAAATRRLGDFHVLGSGRSKGKGVQGGNCSGVAKAGFLCPFAGRAVLPNPEAVGSLLAKVAKERHATIRLDRWGRPVATGARKWSPSYEWSRVPPPAWKPGRYHRHVEDDGRLVTSRKRMRGHLPAVSPPMELAPPRTPAEIAEGADPNTGSSLDVLMEELDHG